jgi:hypothetical protein
VVIWFERSTLFNSVQYTNIIFLWAYVYSYLVDAQIQRQGWSLFDEVREKSNIQREDTRSSQRNAEGGKDRVGPSGMERQCVVARTQRSTDDDTNP